MACMMEIDGRNFKAENVITDVFITLMCSVFLLIACDYRRIADCKYTIFLVICGGYCAVMAFTVFQRFIFRAEGFEKSSADSVSGAENKWSRAARAAAVFYLLFTLISAFLSDYFPETIVGISRHDGALTETIYVLIFIFVSKYYSPRLRHLVIFAASVIIFAAAGLAQAAGFDLLRLYPEGLAWVDRNVKYSGEFITTIGNADLVSAFLCIAVPLFLCASVFFIVFAAGSGKKCSGKYTEKQSKMRFRNIFTGTVCFAAGILSLALMMVIKVSAGITALCLTAVFTAPLIFTVCAIFKNFNVLGNKDIVKRLLKRLKRNLKLYVCVVAAAAIMFFSVVYADGSLRGAAGELHEIIHGNIDDSFGSGRIYIYRNIVKDIPKNLLFGSGPDTVSKLDIEPFTRFDAERGITITAHIDTAHNEQLNILACQGIFALGAWAAVIFCTFAGGLKKCIVSLKCLMNFSADMNINEKSAAEKRCAAESVALTAALTVSFTAAFIAYIIQSMFSFSSCAVTPYFWLLCAALNSAVYLPSQRENFSAP